MSARKALSSAEVYSLLELCKMLEADDTQRGTKTDYDEDSDNEDSEYMRRRRNAFVSYDMFLESYWPHFPQSLTKGLGTVPRRIYVISINVAALRIRTAPALVFGEIMGTKSRSKVPWCYCG